MRYLGIDLGTTTVTGMVLDVETGEVVAVRTVANACEVTGSEDRQRGRSEWDAEVMMALVLAVMREAVAAGGPVAGIGVTGQMHGMVLVDGAGQPVGPFMGWQDRRGMATMAGVQETYVDRMRAVARETEALERGCRPHTGYLGTTLFWMAVQDRLPGRAVTASFLPDYVVSVLTGTQPVSRVAIAGQDVTPK